MGWLIDFFTGIADTVMLFIDLIVGIFTSLINLIMNIPTYLSIVTTSINILPSFAVPFALAYISIVVVQFIINRKSE